MVKPVTGFLTKFDRFFLTKEEATLNETEFILREELDRELRDSFAIEKLFELLSVYRNEFSSYLSALGASHGNPKEPSTKTKPAPAPRTPQGGTHPRATPLSPDV